MVGENNRGSTLYETEKCRKDTFVFDGDDCTSIFLDFLYNSKEMKTKLKIKMLNITSNYKHKMVVVLIFGIF